MMLLADLRNASVVRLLKKEMAGLSGLCVYATPISPRRICSERKMPKRPQTFVLTLLGNDQTGIVYRVSKVLAQRRINIIDLQTKLIQSQRQKLYSLLMEIETPASLSQKTLTLIIKKLASELSADIRINRAEPLAL